MPSKRTTIYIAETDRQALTALQDRYGLASLSDAIRLAVRTLARQPERLQTAQEEQRSGLHSNRIQPCQFSPVVMETALPAAGPASVLQDEQVEILTEQLRGTQEELVLTQGELARTQEELHWTNEELHALNQAMLAMAADRNGDVPAIPLRFRVAKAREEKKALIALNHQQVALLFQQSGLLRAENRRLVLRARVEITKLWQALAA